MSGEQRMKTPDEARALWASELKSGKWKQGQRRLETKGPDGQMTHCCLGVACRLYIQEGGELDVGSFSEGDLTVTTFDGADGVLPEKVADWLGFQIAKVFPENRLDGVGELKDTILVGDGDHPIPASCLTSANDKGLTFDKIADLIEERKLVCQA